MVVVVVTMRNATLTTRRTTETSPHDNKIHDRQVQLRQSFRPVQRATSFEAYRQWIHLTVIIAIFVGVSSIYILYYPERAESMGNSCPSPRKSKLQQSRYVAWSPLLDGLPTYKYITPTPNHSQLTAKQQPLFVNCRMYYSIMSVSPQISCKARTSK